MSSPSRWFAVLVLLAGAAPGGADDGPATPDAPASAGRHCQGESRPRWLATTTLVGALNPRGLELQLEVGHCQPLITRPGLLFDHTNFQVGLMAGLAPVYAMPGVFLSVAPLSVLELRAEAQYVQEWTIGLDGAGYFPLSGYDADWSTLPAAEARPAHGYVANLLARLRGELPLGASWSLLAVNTTSFQFWQLGDAPYYYNTRYDLPMARREWLLRDVALLLASHPLSDRVKLRVGAVDDFSRVTGSGYRQNVLAGLLAAVFSGWPGPRDETLAFLRLGGYTAHAYLRGELQLYAGVGVTWDLSRPPN
jgi:hypothetical protein